MGAIAYEKYCRSNLKSYITCYRNLIKEGIFDFPFKNMLNSVYFLWCNIH